VSSARCTCSSAHTGWPCRARAMAACVCASAAAPIRSASRRAVSSLSVAPSAGLEGAEDCWWQVAVTAWRAGLGQQTRRVIVRGDGAEWIWNRAAHFLGGPGIVVVEILDLFHAYEHLWAAGRAVFDTPDALTAWAEPLKDALYAEGAPAVLAALDALVPPSPAAADVVRRERAYFADNATRMDDPRYVAQQLPIGSGAVESLCKTLIEAREKGAGMRWTQAAAQAVATLRAVRASGDWATHPLRTRLRLCPPGRPRRRATASAPAPAEDVRPLARPTPPAAAPPAAPAPSVAADPAVPAHRPAASHPWRRAPPRMRPLCLTLSQS